MMNRDILIIFNEQELAETVQEILQTELSDEPNKIVVDSVRNRIEAERKLEARKYELLITYLDIPPERKRSREPEAGLSLLRSLEDKQIRIPSILVSSSHNPKLTYSTQDLFECKIVFMDPAEEFEKKLICYSKKALMKKQPGYDQELVKESCRGDVDIILDLDKINWSYKLKGIGVEYEDYGVLDIDANKMRDLVILSRQIGEIKTNWESSFKNIGKDLMQEIFQKNQIFNAHFFDLINRVGGRENARIRFIVEKEIHPLALEALIQPESQYWMIDTPVYRKLMVPGEKSALFHDKETRTGPINCLIIESDYYGDVPGMKDPTGRDLHLVRLRNVNQESQMLEDFLRDNKSRFKIDQIKRINKESEEIKNGTSFAEFVKNTLEGECWHLVHYAGHSVYINNGERRSDGFIFFPGDIVEPINIELFARWLRKTRFVYLSSCQSCEENFAFELAQNKIPAILGFRWDVDDDQAADHAKAFYRKLFQHRSLEKAFMKSRRKMYQAHREGKVWASPVLILQITN